MSTNSHRTGVYSIDDLRKRCVVDPDTECWHWGGAFSASHKTKSGLGVPVTYLPALQSVVTCGRAAVILTRGEDAVLGMKVIARCRHSDCCNPAHMLAGTPAQVGRVLAKSGRWKGNVSRIAANTKAGRANSAFTIKDIEAMRASGLNGKQLAALHGISRSHACRILRGEVWRMEQLRGSSVFAWMPKQRKKP